MENISVLVEDKNLAGLKVKELETSKRLEVS
jgi:hypothetical protein